MVYELIVLVKKNSWGSFMVSRWFRTNPRGPETKNILYEVSILLFIFFLSAITP